MSATLRKGVLLAFDGIDGAGKTTQAQRITKSLTDLGLDVITSKEPTDGPWGQRIRQGSTTKRMSPRDELEAFRKDREEHVRDLIAPALAASKIVVLDRYFLSTAAYQGARGFDPEEILEANESFAPIPDAVFLLDVHVDVGLRRIETRGQGSNLFELRENLEAARGIFRSIERDYIRQINGEDSIDSIAATIARVVFEGPLFRSACLKDYLDRCEPAYCAYRLSGECAYPRYGSLAPSAWSAANREALRALDRDQSLSPEQRYSAMRDLLG
jgi:dTMP kinase